MDWYALVITENNLQQQEIDLYSLFGDSGLLTVSNMVKISQ
jgi:hypothetical protein